MLRLFEKALPAGDVHAGITHVGSTPARAMVRQSNSGALTLSAGMPLTNGDLRRARISVVLGPDAYSLQLVEAPNVAAEEVREAVQWRIQHLIEFPVADAIVETFEMPPPANPGASAMIYAVVAHRDEIKRQVELLKQDGLRISTVDIPELCMRNIAVRLSHDAQGVAFLHYVGGYGYLTITRGGLLYLARRIETQGGEFYQTPDEVALEVQRSLDHYESHYDCRPINELVLGPGRELAALRSSLAENLGIPVNTLDLAELFSGESVFPEDEDNASLLAIGAALRDEKAMRSAA